MFETKRNTLYEKKEKSLAEMNIFEKEMFKSEHETLSGNGALKFSTSGNPFVDDFAALGIYKNPRDISEVFATMNHLWSIDPIKTLKLTVYLRMITRNTKLFDGTKLTVQRGQGLKAEFFNRLLWLATYHPNTFKKNIDVFICAGSWDDIFELMRLDLSYVHDGNPKKRALDWNFLFKIICSGLEDKDQVNLVKKYLPTIKSASQCKTVRSQQNNYIGKFIANKLFEGDKQQKYAAYRRLKSSGTAHEWQQLISQQRYQDIDFNKIAGRALSILTNSKFLENHGLEDKFAQFILSQESAKYTGFVYELFAKPLHKKYQRLLVDKQFTGLINTAKQNMNRDSNFIVCVDTSGSMTSPACGTNISSYDVAKAMALYFSHLLEGKFANTFLEFNSIVKMHTWSGKTPTEKFFNFNSSYVGSTNFLGVAKLFAELKSKGYAESDFPTGVICISDGEFNYSHSYGGGTKQTTFKNFKSILRNAGFSEEFVSNFKIVLWDIPNGYYGGRSTAKFEGLADEPNFFYMSGFDPTGIAFLTGTEVKEKVATTPKNAEELFEEAMKQELLLLLRI